MGDDKQRPVEQMKQSRRNFLAAASRQVLTGTIAAAAVVARAKTAAAWPRCFLRGTKILTLTGERKIEDLAAGDLLPTVIGGMRRIQWIGMYSYKRSDARKPWVESARPIRVARSALAPNVPHADLFLTQSHALFVDGMLIHVANLINGTTIARCAADDVHELEYFHIKLETHDVIYAEGAPCESLRFVNETANNFPDFFRRHGMPQNPDRPCVPLLPYSAGLRSWVRNELLSWNNHQQQKLKLKIIRDRLEAQSIVLDSEVNAPV